MNNAYKDFVRLAYRRTVLAALQRHLQDFLPSEVPASRTLQCEEVLVNDRDVPDEAFMDMLEDLVSEEALVRGQMNNFEFRRKDDGSRLRLGALAKPEGEKEPAEGDGTGDEEAEEGGDD